jgi:cytochrome c oxidase subunit 2
VRAVRLAIAVLAAAAVLTSCGNLGLPDPATKQGDDTRNLWRLFVWVAIVIGIIVYALTIYVIIRYRRRRASDGSDGDEPSQRQYNVPVEVIYTAIPLVIVGILFGLSWRLQRKITDTSDTPYTTIRVVGFQWQWQFEYQDEKVVVTGVPGQVPVLMLPADRTVRLELVSPDVVHSFWVPNFIEKRDLTPRVDNEIDVDVKAPGEWMGLCSEFCGLEHTGMRFIARAVSVEQFDAWLASGGKSP